MSIKTLKHKYSPAEIVLLRLLPRHPKRITINELTENYYADREHLKMPFHGRIFINASMLRLMTKAKANRDVRIMRSAVRPYEYWLADKRT